MEKLTICCKTLYDNDMINKQNELIFLKVIVFIMALHFSKQEFEKRKQELFYRIKK